MGNAMQPNIHLNVGAVLVAAIAAWVIGALWYGPLFGKPWRKEMGVPEGGPPPGAAMAKSLVINFVGLLIMSFVFMHDVLVFRPSVWIAGQADAPSWVYGLFGAVFIWLGYIVPVLLNTVAFEKRTWKLFGINAAYQLVALLAMGMILSYWRTVA